MSGGDDLSASGRCCEHGRKRLVERGRQRGIQWGRKPSVGVVGGKRSKLRRESASVRLLAARVADAWTATFAVVAFVDVSWAYGPNGELDVRRRIGSATWVYGQRQRGVGSEVGGRAWCGDGDAATGLLTKRGDGRGTGSSCRSGMACLTRLAYQTSRF